MTLRNLGGCLALFLFDSFSLWHSPLKAVEKDEFSFFSLIGKTPIGNKNRKKKKKTIFSVI